MPASDGEPPSGCSPKQPRRAGRTAPSALDDPEVRRAFSPGSAGCAGWMPELASRASTTSSSRDLLPALAAGKRSFAELRRAPLLDLLRGALAGSSARRWRGRRPSVWRCRAAARCGCLRAGPSAGSRGAHPGAVRPCRDSAPGRRPRAGAPPPPRPQQPAAAGHPRPGELLGEHLSAGARKSCRAATPGTPGPRIR